MTTFEVSADRPAQVEADLLVLPCFQGRQAGTAVAEVSAALGADLLTLLGQHGFTGHVGETFESLTFGRLRAGRLLLVGMGEASAVSPAVIRQASMMAAGPMTAAGRVAACLPPAQGHRRRPDGGPDDVTAAASAFAEGLLLGAYSYGPPAWAGPPGRKPAHITVLTRESGSAAAAAGLRRGDLLARLTNWTRDLVNAPAAEATPAALVAEAEQLASSCGLGCTVLTRGDLADGGFGGIIAVGQGSGNPPFLVEMSYRGGGNAGLIAMTGKGITFDSGGLTLKRTSEIEWMKSDMAGAASVMAVLRAVAELGLPVNVDVALPFAENLPGGTAVRPGDVVTHRGGRTSEVVDTDCEGRLVVADALAYLAERQPAALVDVATLTDAAGLGEELWAIMGNDSALIASMLAAGQEAGDPGWQLPLPASYRRYLDSPVASLRNLPKDVPDTTVMAGLYLAQFTVGIPWAHLDNGSTAYLEHPTVCWPTGATGSPARALLRWIEQEVDTQVSQS